MFSAYLSTKILENLNDFLIILKNNFFLICDI